MASHDWCAINCAVGVCPPQTCRCGDAPIAGAGTQAAPVPSLRPLKLADIDASTCISVSPTATSYWCQLKCSNGGHCPERLCQCETAVVTDGVRSTPSAHPAQPKPWWRMNKKQDEADPDEAEPEVGPDEAEAEPDPATQPKQQPSWSRTAQPTAWWKNEAEPAESVKPATGETEEEDGGCPSYVSLAGDVQSAFSQVDDAWCESNCRGGNCPGDKCICSTDASAIHEAMTPDAAAVVPSPAAAPSAHAAQPTPWWRANKKKSNDESGVAQQKPNKHPKQPTPWWRDCGDTDCADKKTDTDEQQLAKTPSVHPKQPVAWWKHEEQKEQQGTGQGMEGYMYPGENDWKDTAEIYEEGADDDYEAKLEPTDQVGGKPSLLEGIVARNPVAGR